MNWNFDGIGAPMSAPPPVDENPFQIRRPYGKPGEPERFRLAKTITSEYPHLRQETVSFRFRTRVITATGTIVHWHFPLVRRLRIHPSRIQDFLNWLTSLLPLLVDSWIKGIFPEWFLPPNIILKTQKQDQEELFDKEVKAYNLLRPIQGITVPRFYGLTRYEGARSIILQDIGGASLFDPKGLLLDFEELRDLLQTCHREIHPYGIHQGDTQLGNFQLVDGRMMALDFEMAEFDLAEERKTLFMKLSISEIARKYRDAQLREWKRGNLEAA
ncbi:hypothetical protein PT974_01025 [Cladobotryum mycophilum]|uniref:Uncharacterized protein n=1 Tax=Cladobotryum mycophilum TaxID=491253 RepID=A0ABR0T338_9HYPO